MKRLIVGILIGATVAGGAAWGQMVPPGTQTPEAHRAHYALQSDLWGYPYTLKLRHCLPEEDRLADLRMVQYRPADAVVIYRCVKP